MVLFERARLTPLSKHLRSSDACDYLYRNMSYMGWLAPKNLRQRRLYKLWTYLACLCGLAYLPVGLLITYIVNFDKFTTSEFVTSVQVCINAFGNSIKCSILILQLWRLRKITALVDQLDARCVKPQQREIQHHMVARCNQVVLVYVLIYGVFVTTTMLTAIYSGHLPWQLHNPLINWRNGQKQFLACALLEYLTAGIVAIQEQLCDTYSIVFIYILRCHLHILKERIGDLHSNANTSAERNHRQLLQCIKDHQIILNCCNIIRPIISATIFTQFMLIGVVLGLALINILLYFSDIWSGLANASFVLVLLMETFPFCMNCDLLIEDCRILSNAIFHSNWVDTDRKYRLTLLQFLYVAQQPIQFVAGGIFPISIQTNIEVAKIAFTIITIANQMNFGKNAEVESV